MTARHSASQETRRYGHLGLLAGIFKDTVAKGKNISIDLNDRLGEFFKNAENDPAQALMSINGFNEKPVRNPT